MDDDRDLYQAWVGGDRGAGKALVERHYPALERFFSHKTSGAPGDLVQQTLLRLLEVADRFRGQGSFRSFLFGVARHILSEHIRRRMRLEREHPDFAISAIIDLDPGVSTIVERELDKRRLVMALQRIPLDLQLLLELHYWEELGVDELADVFDVPAGTIKSRLFRARQSLRETIEKLPVTDEERKSASTLIERWIAQMKDLEAE